MKSTQEDLQKRGFASEEDIAELAVCSEDQLILLLHGESAVVRTAAAHHLSSQHGNVTDELLVQLICEKCLYTRIAICECLERGNQETAGKMIPYLGKIGHNQYKKVPEKVSAKKSFPLPRDIIARTLGKMDASIFPVLTEVLESGDCEKTSEVLDAIGFMIFYHGQLADSQNARKICQIEINFPGNSLLIWKMLLCLSAFPLEETVVILEKYAQRSDILGMEARRSLMLWRRRQ